MQLANVRQRVRERPLNEFQIHAFLYAGSGGEARIQLSKHPVESFDLTRPILRLVTNALAASHRCDRERQDLRNVKDQLAGSLSVVGETDALKALRHISQRMARTIGNRGDEVTQD